MSKIKLNETAYGTWYQIIWFDDQVNVGALVFSAPYQDDKGNYYAYSWQDIIDEVMKASNNTAISFILIAEYGLKGRVYHWNKHDGYYQVGVTRGYA